MATGRALHIDTPLTNLTIQAFNTGQGQFIAQQVLPPVTVDKESNVYYTISKEAFFRIPNTARARKTKANRIEFDVSSDTYFAREYALAGDIALQDLANADNALQLRSNTVNLVQVGMLRDLEVRVANRVTSATNLGSGALLTGGNKWSDYVNSDPMSNVTTAHAFIRQQTGYTANTAIIDIDTLAILRRHPVLLDMFKYTSGGEVTDSQIQQLFKVGRVLVGNGIKENALEGGTSSVTNIWGNNCILAYIEPSPGGLQTATFGLSMRWTPDGYPAPFTVGRQVFAGPGTENIEVVEAGYFQDEKIVAKSLAYGIMNTL
jgi:hypothetical protein